MNLKLSNIPFPNEFGEKLWHLSPLFYFLAVFCVILIIALVWTTIQLRKAEADRVAQAIKRVEASQELENFIKEMESVRREEARNINQDARENLKVLAGLSNILDRISKDSERDTKTLREDISREATAMKTHVTHAIETLQNHLSNNTKK